MAETRTGAELVQDFITTYAIEFVFGNPGTTETTFLAALAGSSAKYVLALNEPSAVGIAAGYSLATGKTAMVSLHTYPGLASGMFNLRNAYLSGIPLFVVNGTEDSRFLVHNPVLGGPNTQLAETATKYQYEVRNIDELTVAMQRCWVQAGLQPTRPVFLSVPMDFMQGSTDRVTFKATQILDDAASASIAQVADALRTAEKLAIIVDYAVGWDRSVPVMTNVAVALGADIYAAPFHVQGVCDMLHPTFKGALPPSTKEVREILSRYDTVLLLGEKLDTFTYTGDQSVPPELRMIQITPATEQLGFDWPVDIAVVGDIRASLDGLARALGVDPDTTIATADVAPDLDALRTTYSAPDRDPSDAVIFALLEQFDTVGTHVVTEGSSEDELVQQMATELGFRNVHFSPRGGALGWAMPLSVGISLSRVPTAQGPLGAVHGRGLRHHPLHRTRLRRPRARPRRDHARVRCDHRTAHRHRRCRKRGPTGARPARPDCRLRRPQTLTDRFRIPGPAPRDPAFGISPRPRCRHRRRRGSA